MKSWEPEMDFGEADFPRKGKGSEATKNSPGGNASTPGARPRPVQPEGRAHTDAAPETPKPDAAPAPRVFSPAFRRLEPGGTIGAAPVQAEQRVTGKVVGRASEQAPTADASSALDLQRRLVGEAALTSPERTLRLLRKWYWEGQSPSAGPRTSSIAAADRIRIVLDVVGERIAIYLLELMSPVERGTFQTILRDKRSYSQATKNVACREFTNGLQRENL